LPEEQIAQLVKVVVNWRPREQNEQAALALAFSCWYFPAAHKAQAMLFSSKYDPAAQNLHVVLALSSWYFPISQLEQPEEPLFSAYVPRSQGKQASLVFCPVFGENKPAAQDVQLSSDEACAGLRTERSPPVR
jgi:hypothetical protein